MNNKEIIENIIIKKDKKLVIFDFDGVIGKLNIDWIKSRKTAKELLKKNYNFMIEEDLRLDQIEYLVNEKFGEDILKDILKIREQFEEQGIHNSDINKDVVQLITDLNKIGTTLTVCSNNLSITIETFLRLFKLEKFFKCIVGVDNAIAPKPSIKGCEQILHKYPIDKKQILFIGDQRDIDEEVAKKMNIDYINRDRFNDFNY
ncbi:HAD family hydrolase [archaeon]|jgi:phosphoglycolate phosphatase-like HAD superfamily hydrolase|nr:HAD family hydrolase [archaeon]MBT6824232.1 HAD family hydrolase [archaeon]MBT7106770.1 HAD family hydrolase [archaeon]MBT7297536.1 HAD family hydrolase [archaeon]